MHGTQLFMLAYWIFTLPPFLPIRPHTTTVFRFHVTDLAGDPAVLTAENTAGGKGSVEDDPDWPCMAITKDGKHKMLQALENSTLHRSSALPTATPPMTPHSPTFSWTSSSMDFLPFAAPPPLSPAAPTKSCNFWCTIGSMFSPNVTDKAIVFSAVSTVLSLSGVTSDRGRVRRTLKALDQGNMDAGTWVWVLKNLKSKRGLQELRTTKKLTFNGPRWSQPQYKSARGVAHLLGAVNNAYVFYSVRQGVRCRQARTTLLLVITVQNSLTYNNPDCIKTTVISTVH